MGGYLFLSLTMSSVLRLGTRLAQSVRVLNDT